jgi:hypothetical protein
MLIGADFEKIEFSLLGLNLVEPNALIGDFILASIAFLFAYKINKLKQKIAFFKHWYWFFVLFGISFIGGGLGHSLFNYWGVQGKYLGWLLAIVCIYFIESALISIYPSDNRKQLFSRLAQTKFVLAFLLEISIFIFIDLESDPQKGLLIPGLNTAIGSILCLGVLGWMFQKQITDSFKYFWMVPIIMIPAAIIQSYKISMYPWFDRNDLSHIFLLISLFLYWWGVKGYSTYLKQRS